MKHIDIKDVETGQIYCYYEITSNNPIERYVAFCKVVCITDCLVKFLDVCNYRKRNSSFEVENTIDSKTFDVILDSDDQYPQMILIFQLTEFEILNHVVAEIL